MLKPKYLHTKIIATIGPACSDKKVLSEMFKAGLDVCRLNFSHGKHEDHVAVIKTIRELNEELETNVAILADLQGPKLRVGEVLNNGVELVNGSTLKMVSEECIGTAEKVYMSYEPLPKDVKPGETILVDDGKIKLEVISTNNRDEVVTKVISGGILSSRKGVNLPNTKVSLPSLTKKDIEDVNFVLEFDIDWIALSFVRTVTDIIELKEIVKNSKKNTKVIAKIEKPEAIKEIDNIIEVTDGIMIARGDLGVETPFDEVPMLQKKIVNKCIINSKPVIIATQMMESMITNFRPTRAEATDVANAVIESADALMLSGETSVGNYPIDVIKSMQKVILATEGNEFTINHDHKPNPKLPSYLPDSICYNACKMADLTKAKALVVFTIGGASVYKLVSNRPKANIYAFTPNKQIMTQLSLLRGVQTFYMEPEQHINEAIYHSTEILKKYGFVSVSDIIVYVGGIPMRLRGPINTMKIAMVD
ncbi:MAG: pyruvate kinase [Bacteroidales bacterium]|nr:pyruvate kinase [Bacteroidales bacterium]MBN2819016.1 pyruvate kinase [Bacteroidales bacterium]